MNLMEGTSSWAGTQWGTNNFTVALISLNPLILAKKILYNLSFNSLEYKCLYCRREKIQIWVQKDFNPIMLAIAVLAPSLNKKNGSSF